MNRVSMLATLIPRTCVRRLSVTQASFKEAASDELKKKQIQLNNTDPVYLKGGLPDYILFYSTLVLIAVGFGISGSSIYKLASKG